MIVTKNNLKDNLKREHKQIGMCLKKGKPEDMDLCDWWAYKKYAVKRKKWIKQKLKNWRKLGND